ADEVFTLGEELPARVRAATGGRGVDLVLDLIGGAHFTRLLAALAPRGKLVLVGLVAGARAELELDLVLRRRLTLIGSVLRSRDRTEKAALVADFLAFAAPRLAARRMVPVVERVLELESIAAAYALLERGRPFGKVVVRLPG
ncbi:MAG: zinc-binding dehydrogenase, partial [Thermoanaerobaculia bacterium]